jgi:hypothetical protein
MSVRFFKSAVINSTDQSALHNTPKDDNIIPKSQEIPIRSDCSLESKGKNQNGVKCSTIVGKKQTNITQTSDQSALCFLVSSDFLGGSSSSSVYSSRKSCSESVVHSSSLSTISNLHHLRCFGQSCAKNQRRIQIYSRTEFRTYCLLAFPAAIHGLILWETHTPTALEHSPLFRLLIASRTAPRPRELHTSFFSIFLVLRHKTRIVQKF